MSILEHNHRVHFPNGMGYTPCTKEYRLALDEREAICDPNEGESIHDLSSEDYQRWSELDNALGLMQLDGHLGKAVRY
ncbi:hypothetical protein ACP46_gp53 [Rhizobium phage RHEph06]|uniref:Uncharacterized protein n=4 Tax=Kleczkowskavirus RHEph4 TaxID=1921526 RepID=A0A7S5QX07_9CAUD|nr:hypothetical protein ACP46_gp53 [Rhizobium phage RHEph06]YP_009598494.1 hypothetical protein FDH25_gp52 [Rhizobium phage RHEph04]AGC35814.1 hypothetical protein RHEph05_gp047 [Rhizobium phage RHEph05]QIG67677.1 hypothetical protein EVB51_060 [Rhizobium phage RHph_Y17]QIG68996.1 hypothetical protein EVB73_060 [Rhizobium phage RHph_Y3_43]QIG69545.1 hypothetical protein EVB80_062 [Rhizobium phage RHph_I36]QIG75419.1 hypothetical protein EVC17_062 [Rhizobium phage RHph_Y1_1]QIG75969.1 hypothe